MIDLRHGDCLDVLRADLLGYDYRLGYFPPAIPDGSVDAVVTDPPYGLEFMGREWDGANGFRRSLNPADVSRDNPFGRTSRTSPEYRAGALFQEWSEAWARECFRVLKPGGHLLAFGGTRTWHRLTCAVEDSGFDIRDSVAWLYGSGFPKSLDVSKAIDKAAGAERPILDTIPDRWAGKGNVLQRSTQAPAESVDITAPATDAARTWQGWGTALKPAFEPVVVARKPLGGSVNIQARVEHELRRRGVEGEIRWTTRPASDVESPSPTPTSGSTAPPRTGATSAGIASDSATPPTASATASDTERSPDSGEPTTSSTPATTSANPTANYGGPSSTHTDPTAPVAASPTRRSSRSTTSTEAAPSTASQSTGRSTPSYDAKASRPATESFAGIATGLTGSATVLIERLADGSFVWPDDLPEVISGSSTVAANVLAHGTGALNIDGCRTSADNKRPNPGPNSGGSFRLDGCKDIDELRALAETDGVTPNGRSARATLARAERVIAERDPRLDPVVGRWPANVVLDEEMARRLDEQSGETGSGSGSVRVGGVSRQPAKKWAGGEMPMDHEAVEDYGDTGGASRFFYVAKADASERVRVNGTAHPTVKPLALMRWLVRLVTPPGGTVLEPFAGSGTTVEACILEGFSCIAIEREAEYLPLIRQRINRRRDPVEAVRGAGEDGGLFDLLDEEPA